MAGSTGAVDGDGQTGGGTCGDDTAEAGAGGVDGTGGVAGAAGADGGVSCTTPPPASPLVGWAAAHPMNPSGTTGAGDATPVSVTTTAAFNNNAGGTAARVLYVTGSLTGTFYVGSNKTIVGLCGASLHGHVEMNGSVNVIVRNLTIVGYGVGDCALDPTYDPTVGCSSGLDAVSVYGGAQRIWFDHCDISDGTDGNLDITTGSNFVTVSWTKFHYTAAHGQHRLRFDWRHGSPLQQPGRRRRQLAGRRQRPERHLASRLVGRQCLGATAARSLRQEPCLQQSLFGDWRLLLRTGRHGGGAARREQRRSSASPAPSFSTAPPTRPPPSSRPTTTFTWR